METGPLPTKYVSNKVPDEFKRVTSSASKLQVKTLESGKADTAITPLWVVMGFDAPRSMVSAWESNV
jgi:hypothetical protein